MAVVPAALARPGSPAQTGSWGCESLCPSCLMYWGLSDPECQMLRVPKGSQGVVHPQSCPLNMQAGLCAEAALWVTGKELSRCWFVLTPSPASLTLSPGTAPTHLRIIE